METSKNQSDLKKYWKGRLLEPIILTFTLNMLDIMSELGNILSPKSDIGRTVNIIYLINSIVIALLTTPAIFYNKYQKNVRFGYMLITIRNTIRLFDFQQSREHISLL